MVEHCLVEWVGENRWDVWKVDLLPPEHRYEGAIGKFPWSDGKEYVGKVLKMSSNLKVVERAEAELAAKLKQAPLPTKRKGNKTARMGRCASDNEVAKALGERKKLTDAQTALKKATALAKKKKEKAISEVETAEDDALLAATVPGAKRNLFTANVSNSVKAGNTGFLPHTHALDDDEMEADEDSDEEANSNDECVIDILQLHTENEENDNCDSESGGDDDQMGEPTLMSFRNPNTEGFLRYLLNEFSPKTVAKESKEYAQPLQTPDNKMVRLKSKHSLQIAKGSKAKLLVDVKSRKSATLFLRKTLMELYGPEQLSKMTAKGRLKNAVGISDADLNAIYAFVCEYAKGPGLDWDTFITTINKKISSVKFAMNTSGSASKSSTKKQKTSPRKSRDASESVEEQTADTEGEVQVTPRKLARQIIITARNSTENEARPIIITPRKSKESEASAPQHPEIQEQHPAHHPTRHLHHIVPDQPPFRCSPLPDLQQQPHRPANMMPPVYHQNYNNYPQHQDTRHTGYQGYHGGYSGYSQSYNAASCSSYNSGPPQGHNNLDHHQQASSSAWGSYAITNDWQNQQPPNNQDLVTL